MLIDGSLLFADKKELGTTSNTATDSDVIKVSSSSRDLGVGTDVPIVIMISEMTVAETATALTASVSVSDSTTASSGTWQVIATSGAVPIAGIEAGYVFGINKVPFYADKPYMKVSITPAGTAKATTKFTAAIAEAVSKY